ncbi:MAG TPA: hypothetical protein VKT73_00045 [Xanthobacteraceae bacterium]|nr:hypothetical protein [Xanthobacteraceae bacterium]
MSTSEAKAAATDFDRWIVEEFADRGAFTAFVILVEISEPAVVPLCSTYFNVIGDEIDWGEITVLFAGSGRDWDGACFFPADGHPLDNPTARLKLRELETRVDESRLTLNEGHFFDKWGRRLKIEEAQAQ